MMTVERLCRAIQERKVIEFLYKLETRKVEPHALGYDQQGTIVLRGWDRSGLTPGFHDFHVAVASELSIIGEHFDSPRPGYISHAPALARIFCQL